MICKEDVNYLSILENILGRYTGSKYEFYNGYKSINNTDDNKYFNNLKSIGDIFGDNLSVMCDYISDFAKIERINDNFSNYDKEANKVIKICFSTKEEFLILLNKICICSNREILLKKNFNDLINVFESKIDNIKLMITKSCHDKELLTKFEMIKKHFIDMISKNYFFIMEILGTKISRNEFTLLFDDWYDNHVNDSGETTIFGRIDAIVTTTVGFSTYDVFYEELFNAYNIIQGSNVRYCEGLKLVVLKRYPDKIDESNDMNSFLAAFEKDLQ